MTMVDALHRSVSFVVLIEVFVLLWFAIAVTRRSLRGSKIPSNFAWPAYMSKWSRLSWRPMYDQLFNLEEVLSQAYKSKRDVAFSTFIGPPNILLSEDRLPQVARLSMKKADIFSNANDHFGFANSLPDVTAQTTSAFTHNITKTVALHAESLCRGATSEIDIPLHQIIGDPSNWKTLRVSETVDQLVHQGLVRMILGPVLGGDRQIQADTFYHAKTLVSAAIVVQATPWPFHHILAWLLRLTVRRVCKRLEERLQPLHGTCLELLDNNDITENPATKTFVWHWMQTSKRVSNGPILLNLHETMCAVQTLIMAAEFNTSSAAKSLIINIASFDTDGQLIKELLDEIHYTAPTQSDSALSHAACSPGKLRLLDSCLRETFRLHHMDMLVFRRKTLEDVKLGADLVVEKGICFAINAFAIHRDESIYEDATRFNPYRFYKGEEPSRPSHSPDEHYLPFAMGAHTCPGRRFACSFIKLMMIKLLLNYDIEPLAQRPSMQNIGSIRLERRGVEIRVKKKVLVNEGIQVDS